MSEASVARANAALVPETFRCVQCGVRCLTASGLAWHIECVHKAKKKHVPKVHMIITEKLALASIPPKSGGGISARLLSAVQTQGNSCHWCGEPFRLDLGSEHPLSPSREHGKPKSMGGTKILAIVHRRCNLIRGIIEADAFRRLMDGEAVTREDLWPHLFFSAQKGS